MITLSQTSFFFGELVRRSDSAREEHVQQKTTSETTPRRHGTHVVAKART